MIGSNYQDRNSYSGTSTKDRIGNLFKKLTKIIVPLFSLSFFSIVIC